MSKTAQEFEESDISKSILQPRTADALVKEHGFWSTPVAVFWSSRPGAKSTSGLSVLMNDSFPKIDPTDPPTKVEKSDPDLAADLEDQKAAIGVKGSCLLVF
jgi:hypothetical protein